MYAKFYVVVETKLNSMFLIVVPVIVVPKHEWMIVIWTEKFVDKVGFDVLVNVPVTVV